MCHTATFQSVADRTDTSDPIRLYGVEQFLLSSDNVARVASGHDVVAAVRS